MSLIKNIAKEPGLYASIAVGALTQAAVVRAYLGGMEYRGIGEELTYWSVGVFTNIMPIGRVCGFIGYMLWKYGINENKKEETDDENLEQVVNQESNFINNKLNLQGGK